jgi:hypothetical protein
MSFDPRNRNRGSFVPEHVLDVNPDFPLDSQDCTRSIPIVTDLDAPSGGRSRLALAEYADAGSDATARSRAPQTRGPFRVPPSALMQAIISPPKREGAP